MDDQFRRAIRLAQSLDWKLDFPCRSHYWIRNNRLFGLMNGQTMKSIVKKGMTVPLLPFYKAEEHGQDGSTVSSKPKKTTGK